MAYDDGSQAGNATSVRAKGITILTDTETLEWIASHLYRFHVYIGWANMLYLDKDERIQEVIFKADPQPSDVEMLRACVRMAIEGKYEYR